MPDIAFRDAFRLLNALNQHLAAEDAEMWREALRRMLRKQNPWELPISELQTWKTIHCHPFTHAEVEEVLADRMLDGKGWIFAPGRSSTWRHRTVRLHRCTVQEMGFDRPVERFRVYTRVRELGLDFCEDAAVIAFLRQHPHHVEEDSSHLHVPIARSNAELVLITFKGSKPPLKLNVYENVSLFSLFTPEDRLVLALPAERGD